MGLACSWHMETGSIYVPGELGCPRAAEEGPDGTVNAFYQVQQSS
jgi:hypothetical protein